MSPTIRDVAKKANVGVGTVSRVLNDSPQVKEETRKAVLTAIEELDYSPNPIARRLSTGKTLTVGVILPNLTRSSYIERLRGVQETLAKTKYHLVLYSVGSKEDQDAYFREIPRSQMVDGLLIISLPPSDEQAERFAKSKPPTVLIDAYHPSICSVFVDDRGGGKMATEYLIEQNHRKIGFLGDKLETAFHPSTQYRFWGYGKTLEKYGIRPKDEYHIFVEHGRLNARRAAQKLFNNSDAPSAVFASCDTQAIGVMDCADELGLRIPEDLSVIGFDGIPDAEFVNLTTIDQNLYQSGVVGVQMLLESMQELPDNPRKHTIPLELIPRGTTMKKKENN
jgi:DNA-binding LacI/PurR family transcriptional regulator